MMHEQQLNIYIGLILDCRWCSWAASDENLDNCGKPMVTKSACGIFFGQKMASSEIDSPDLRLRRLKVDQVPILRSRESRI